MALGPLGSAILLPLQLLTLLLLHRLQLEWTRARANNVKLDQSTALTSIHEVNEALQGYSGNGELFMDAKFVKCRWNKLPRHVAVLFVHSPNWTSLTDAFTRLRRLERTAWIAEKSHDDSKDVVRLAAEIVKLVRWCEQLEITELSLFDERGIVDRHADQIASIIAQTVATTSVIDDELGCYKKLKVYSSIVPKRTKNDELLPGQEVDSGCGVSDPGQDGTMTPPSTSRTACITVNLLSKRSGRPQLARVAQALSLDRLKGVHTFDTLTTELVHDTIENSSFGEPQLLLVLGGPYLRLHGFPPWQLRLTEMYHHPSPSWLPPPRLTQRIFSRALDLYGGAEMRLGR
ncbi:hypothetical protein OIO90_006157 [Microbotryomycetes sp. JL221]|nr:hypothetical protein OIO90_006157 [Microbotryomycetes sp. JL221]